METLVRKHDKFGWDQMNIGMRQMIREDWLAALAEYSVEEVRAACRQHTIDAPNKVPNEGHIKAIIVKGRAVPSWDAVTADQRDLLEQRICPPSMKLPDGTPNDLARALMATLVRR